MERKGNQRAKARDGWSPTVVSRQKREKPVNKPLFRDFAMRGIWPGWGEVPRGLGGAMRHREVAA